MRKKRYAMHNIVSKQQASKTTSQKLASTIMGRNFLGIDMVIQYFDVTFYTEEDKKEWERAKRTDIPFSNETLEQCKDTHVLFIGAPMTIGDINKEAGLFISESDGMNVPGGETNYSINSESVKHRWYLLRKGVVPGSMAKNFRDQIALLDENESVPKACEVIFMTALYFLATSERLFDSQCVRCSDITRLGGRVYVGEFHKRGFWVLTTGDTECINYLGLAAARNPSRSES